VRAPERGVGGDGLTVPGDGFFVAAIQDQLGSDELEALYALLDKVGRL